MMKVIETCFIKLLICLVYRSLMVEIMTEFFLQELLLIQSIQEKLEMWHLYKKALCHGFWVSFNSKALFITIYFLYCWCFVQSKTQQLYKSCIFHFLLEKICKYNSLRTTKMIWLKSAACCLLSTDSSEKKNSRYFLKYLFCLMNNYTNCENFCAI